MATQAMTNKVPNGPAAAALIAAGIGNLVIGLLTTGAELSVGLKNALNWYNPSGPLTGKTLVGVAVWLISWFVLNNMWKDKNPAWQRIFTTTLVLIGVGFLLTFPPIFQGLAGE